MHFIATKTLDFFKFKLGDTITYFLNNEDFWEYLEQGKFFKLLILSNAICNR